MEQIKAISMNLTMEQTRWKTRWQTMEGGNRQYMSKPCIEYEYIIEQSKELTVEKTDAKKGGNQTQYMEQPL